MFEPKLIEILKSEAEYRAHPAMNYSKCKWWVDKNPLSWRRKFHLGLKDEEPDNKGLNDGHLIDCRLLGTEQEFEEKYMVAEIPELPKPQELRFCEKLMEITLEHTDEDGVFTGDFTECFGEAYKRANIKTPGLEKFTSNFDENCGEYYTFLRQSSGKKVISFQELESADRAVNMLKNDENTRGFFSGEGLNQLPIVFEYEGIVYKALLDRMKIDHERKLLVPKDLKSSYQSQEFHWAYLKLFYYIQEGIYSQAVRAFRDAKYPEYDIADFSFITIDAGGFTRPLDWKFEYPTPGENPWLGFTHRGKRYKGINTIMNEIEWATQKDEWRIKPEHHALGGKITFKIGD